MTSSLLTEPGRYDFYQAMRLLEGGAVPGVAGRPVGFDSEPRHEVARLRASSSLGFPVNAVESVVRRRSHVDGAAKAVDVTVSFMGALGATGALPWHYTEYVFDRLSQRDRSMRDFVDALTHRSIAFHYRAWRKYRLPFAHEAAARTDDVDDITLAMRALVGLGTEGLRERLPEGADRWLYFAGLFARGQRTAGGLESMLQAVCGHPVEVQEFVGTWQPLLPEERSRLGGAGGGDRNELGASMILGSSVWNIASAIRVRIGPVPSTRLPDLVPRTGSFPWLGDLVRSYLGPEVDFELLCLVERPTIRPLQLGVDRGARLGGSAWVDSSDPSHYDAEVPLCASRSSDALSHPNHPRVRS